MVNNHSHKAQARALMAASNGALSYTEAMERVRRDSSTEAVVAFRQGSVLTASEALSLPNNSVVYRTDGLGHILGIGVRQQFRNPGENNGEWGWMISYSDDEESDEEFIRGDVVSDVLFSAPLLSFMDGSALFDWFDWEAYDDTEAEDAARDIWEARGIEVLKALPVGTVVGDADGEPIAAKVQNGKWQTLGCNWTPDEDAIADDLPSATLLMGPAPLANLEWNFR